MKTPTTYETADGKVVLLGGLDRDEKKVFRELHDLSETNPDWNAFTNSYVSKITALYDKRGWPRSRTIKSPLWLIAQDLDGRLAVRQGHARLGDYRDDLADLIHSRFKTRREFCKATGLSEDFVSHILAGRKHLSIEALEKAMGKIGYRLVLQPNGAAARSSPKRVKTAG